VLASRFVPTIIGADPGELYVYPAQSKGVDRSREDGEPYAVLSTISSVPVPVKKGLSLASRYFITYQNEPFVAVLVVGISKLNAPVAVVTLEFVTCTNALADADSPYINVAEWLAMLVYTEPSCSRIPVNGT